MSTNLNELNNYRKPTVFHPKFQKAYDDILALIFGPLTQNLIILVGPTGVGKTWLVRALVNKLKEIKTPAIYFEAFPPLQSTSPFRRFFEDYQQALSDPFANKPRMVEHVPALGPELFRPRSTLDTLSRVVCDRVRKVKPGAVLIDEANVFADLSPAQTQFSLKLFKALANQTQVPHVLVGTEALLNFIGLDSQLQRRGRVIHLDAYLPTTAEERKGFVRLFDELLRAIPIPAHDEIIHRTPEIRDLCYGAPGILADLLLDACKLACKSNMSELRLEHLVSVAIEDKHSVITEEQETIRNHLKVSSKFPKKNISDKSTKSTSGNKQRRVQRETPKQYPLNK